MIYHYLAQPSIFSNFTFQIISFIKMPQSVLLKRRDKIRL